MSEENIKQESNPESNAEKDPKNWVTGDEAMTGAQKSYLTTLSEEAKIEGPSDDLTKAEASVKIDKLRKELGKEDS